MKIQLFALVIYCIFHIQTMENYDTYLQKQQHSLFCQLPVEILTYIADFNDHNIPFLKECCISLH